MLFYNIKINLLKNNVLLIVIRFLTLINKVLLNIKNKVKKN